MSETSSAARTAMTITENDILHWLKSHPDFLLKNPEACDFLLPPKAVTGKGVTDFQSYMIQRLKNDRDVIIEEAREIVETSRANMNNQARIHNSILMLLEAHNFEDFIRTITLDFISLLDVDIITLIVENDGPVIPHIDLTGVRILPADTIAHWMPEQTILLQDNIQGIEAIYGGGAGLVKSQLLLRLNIAPDVPAALIAFGSRDPHLFHPKQGTEQIIFLGRVIERCLFSWLHLGH